jgi:hypothetical protein
MRGSFDSYRAVTDKLVDGEITEIKKAYQYFTYKPLEFSGRLPHLTVSR